LQNWNWDNAKDADLMHGHTCARFKHRQKEKTTTIEMEMKQKPKECSDLAASCAAALCAAPSAQVPTQGWQRRRTCLRSCWNWAANHLQ
jgi:hypothetical protein